MKNMKNKLLRTALSLVTACLLVLAILPQRAEAAGASLSGSSSVQAGNSVTLTLSVDNKILGLTADLNCGDGLTFTNYSCSVSGWSILVNQNHFSVYGTNSASGGIITVTLKVSSSVQGGAALSASFSNIVASDGETDIDVGTASWTGSVAAAPSGDCTLSAIMCGNATLSPAFSSSTTYYTAKVPYSVSKLSLDYNRNDKGQTVNIADLSASYRKAVVDCLVRNFLHAADETGHKKLVIAGGVSANALLRRRLTEECKRTGRTLYMPDLSLTGDNAAMVGAQAYYEYLAGHTAGMELNACAQRSIDLG